MAAIRMYDAAMVKYQCREADRERGHITASDAEDALWDFSLESAHHTASLALEQVLRLLTLLVQRYKYLRSCVVAVGTGTEFTCFICTKYKHWCSCAVADGTVPGCHAAASYSGCWLYWYKRTITDAAASCSTRTPCGSIASAEMRHPQHVFRLLHRLLQRRVHRLLQRRLRLLRRRHRACIYSS